MMSYKYKYNHEKAGILIRSADADAPPTPTIRRCGRSAAKSQVPDSLPKIFRNLYFILS